MSENPVDTEYISKFISCALSDIEIPGLPEPQKGKVRHGYDLDGERRLIVATDRLSAFDRQLTTIPFKGQVLTELSKFWFEQTRHICPNHLIAVPDPNVMICRRLRMLPVELVVRGYLAGSTGTSLLTMYRKGMRQLYGHEFPDGMRDNQQLERPVITPTTKGDVGAHDAPLSSADVVALGLVDADTWACACDQALALFDFGQARARQSGLILVDTKYEFGVDAEGTLILADELHTPDSSRFWDTASYKARFERGEPPNAFDKDTVRRWIISRCDPYRDDIPQIPDAIRAETAAIYLQLFERLTAMSIIPPPTNESPSSRIAKAVHKWLSENALRSSEA